jgi:hypothetical protein
LVFLLFVYFLFNVICALCKWLLFLVFTIELQYCMIKLTKVNCWSGKLGINSWMGEGWYELYLLQLIIESFNI